MIGVDVFVKLLEEYGVEVIFGVFGDINVVFYKVLNCFGKVCYVMVCDECLVFYMVDVYVCYSGKFGVVECFSGVGVMYFLFGMVEVNSFFILLILLINDIFFKGEGCGMIIELDNVKLFELVCKLFFQVKIMVKILEVVRCVFWIVILGCLGVVYLIFFEDILVYGLVSMLDEIYVEFECWCFLVFFMCFDVDLVWQLVVLFDVLCCLVLVVGGGVMYFDGGVVLLVLVEKIDVVVVIIIIGQGVVLDEYLLVFGVIGDNGFYFYVVWVVEESDLLVYFGCKMGLVVIIGWIFFSY